MELKELVRGVQDFPKKGINFKDITTLLKDVKGLKEAADTLANFAKDKQITKVVGIESRGFILGAMVAERLGAGLVLARKPGKLPAEKISESYSLEYGTDSIEMHIDAIEKGDKVLVHDDLLATGGTMEAACKLVERLGGEVVQVSFLIELSFIPGRDKLKNYDVRSIITYQEE